MLSLRRRTAPSLCSNRSGVERQWAGERARTGCLMQQAPPPKLSFSLSPSCNRSLKPSRRPVHHVDKIPGFVAMATAMGSTGRGSAAGCAPTDGPSGDSTAAQSSRWIVLALRSSTNCARRSQGREGRAGWTSVSLLRADLALRPCGETARGRAEEPITHVVHVDDLGREVAVVEGEALQRAKGCKADTGPSERLSFGSSKRER